MTFPAREKSPKASIRGRRVSPADSPPYISLSWRSFVSKLVYLVVGFVRKPKFFVTGELFTDDKIYKTNGSDTIMKLRKISIAGTNRIVSEMYVPWRGYFEKGEIKGRSRYHNLSLRVKTLSFIFLSSVLVSGF